MAKLALLIGVSDYLQEFPALPSSQQDINAMQNILRHSEISDFDDVVTLINPERQDMQEAIDVLFSGRERNDLVLFYYSGHGIKDESGRLYLATPITRKNARGELVKSTAVAANFIHDIMDNSRSTRQVVVLDCCFSGAFAEGLQAKKDNDSARSYSDLGNKIDIESQLGGEGRAILTSSTSVQYSFEQKGVELSIYTRYLIEGIETGAADLDGNGWISIDELHQYAKKKVQGAAPAMNPEIYAVREGFRIQLIRARTNDPLLAYRKEVEQCAFHGNISKIGRRILDRQKEQFGISNDQAKQIEDAVLQPFREYQRKVKEYEDAFNDATQFGGTLSDFSRQELSRLKNILGLRDEDVALIENPSKQPWQSQFLSVLPVQRFTRVVPSRSSISRGNYYIASDVYFLFQKSFWTGVLGGLLGILLSSLMGFNFWSILIWLAIQFSLAFCYLYSNAFKYVFLSITFLLFLLVGSVASLNSSITSFNTPSIFVTIFLVCIMSGLATFLFASLCVLLYKILASLSQ